MWAEAHATRRTGRRCRQTARGLSQDGYHASVRLFAFLTHDAPATGLPDFAGVEFNRRQPAMTPASGIDTDGEPQIKNLGVLLFCVADDHSLTCSSMGMSAR